MIYKWSLLGVGRFYTAEEALTFLMNMSDFEDESTSESENEGDSSDSSEYTPEQQYQVRNDSNIQTLLPKETINQNATMHALLADETATTSGEEHVASPPKVSKVKEIPKKGQKAILKPVVNQNATKHALLADETATTSGEEHVASPPKVYKAKEIPKKGQKAAPKKFTSYWCSICKHALCIDPCFRLYHTEKDYTGEIIKIARTSVKPIQKDAQHVQKDAQHVQKDAQHVQTDTQHV